MLVFKKEKIGGSKNLVYADGKFAWTDDNRTSILALDSSCMSFENLLKLFKTEVPEFVPERYRKAAKTLGLENPPWLNFLGKEHFMAGVKAYCSAYDNLSESFDASLIKRQLMIECMIRRMHPAPYDPNKIDNSVWEKYNKKLQIHYKNGFIDPVSYVRTKTTTGRLTVASGPSVLTMDSKLRAGLMESLQIDFCSMEPNLLLAYQGKDTHSDLYTHLAKELKLENVSRPKIKLAIISSLYNSESSGRLAQKVSNFFEIKKTIKSLGDSVKDGVLLNMYGRPIHVAEAKKNHLLSLWLQSSAVDAALIGFCNLLRQNPIIKPYWIIHDALIINKVDLNLSKLSVGNGFELPIKLEAIDEIKK